MIYKMLTMSALLVHLALLYRTNKPLKAILSPNYLFSRAVANLDILNLYRMYKEPFVKFSINQMKQCMLK